MDDTQKDLEQILKTLKLAETLLASGQQIDNVCEQLGITNKNLQSWADHLSLPVNPGDVLSSSRIHDAVTPIFVEDAPDAPLEHIASAVLLRIDDDLFALTAAHVIDAATGSGALFMPAAGGIDPITGSLSFKPVPDKATRNKDIIDMGYYKLSSDWSIKLHPAFKPLPLDDILLADNLATGDIFTFVGYPWRKTKSRSTSHESDRTTYTGPACAPDVYTKLGYNRSLNIATSDATKQNAQYQKPIPSDCYSSSRNKRRSRHRLAMDIPRPP